MVNGELIWITQDISSIAQGKQCPVCNSSNTESKGKRTIKSGTHNKRHCRQCDKYYYIKEQPLQVFYSVT